MKIILAFTILTISQMCFSQETQMQSPPKENSAKAHRNFELQASYGYGISAPPVKTFIRRSFGNSLPTPVISLRFGVRIFKDFHLGVQSNFQSIEYEYDFLGKTQTLKVGQPTTNLGPYVSYSKNFGIFSPYIIASPSIVFTSIQLEGFEINRPYSAYGYGAAAGVCVNLAKGFSLFPEYMFTRNVLRDYGNFKRSLITAGIRYEF